jgi:thioredoxin-related protein
MKSLKAFLLMLLFICASLWVQGIALAETLDLPASFEGESLLSGQKTQVQRVDEKSKGLVLIFMSVKCPCSNSHVDLVKKLSQQYKDFRFLVVHSNPEENKSESQTYFKSFAPTIEVLQDEKTKLADLLKAYKTPHAFVFNSKGEIVYRGGVTNSAHAPSADRQYLAEVLQDVSEGKKPRIDQGRTLGCVISREGEKNVF